jgi:DNA replication protein DnaC
MANRLSHTEFLELLVQDELGVRGDRAVDRRTRAAQFRDQKSLSDFDWDFNRGIFDAVRDLLHDESIDNHDKVMSKYLKPDLLILDDMGIKSLPKRSGEFLSEIIMRRRD